MVDAHHPHRVTASRAFVVKRDKRKIHITPRSHCLICGAVLCSDHRAGDLMCSCHHVEGYNPRHDGAFDLRVLMICAAAGGGVVNVCKVLGVEGRDGHNLVCESARLWRSMGVNIVGVRGVGYRIVKDGEGKP